MKTLIRSTLIAILTSMVLIFIFFIVSSLLKTEKPGFVTICVFAVLTLAFVTFRYPDTKPYLSAVIYLPILSLLIIAYKGEGMKYYLINIFTCSLITYIGAFLGSWLHLRSENRLSRSLKTGVYIISLSLVIILAAYLTKRYARLDKPVIASLDTIFKADQDLRKQSPGEINSPEWKAWSKKISQEDSINIIKVAHIINENGWPGEDVIGWSGSSTLWAVIQHSSLENQEKYLPLIREAAENGKARWVHVALLEDRILVEKGKLQIYGSQARVDSLGIFKICPIKDEKNVNKRRFSVGLGPLQWYAKQIGLTYSLDNKTKRE